MQHINPENQTTNAGKAEEDINKLIHKFLHPLLRFAGNAELLTKISALLQSSSKALPPGKIDALELGLRFKHKLSELFKLLDDTRLQGIEDKIERSDIQDFKRQLIKITNVLDNDLQTETRKTLLETKIRNAAIWTLDELNKIDDLKKNLIDAQFAAHFTEFIRGILFQHLVRGAQSMKSETRILRQELEALRTYIGLEKSRRYSFELADIGDILEDNILLFEPTFYEKGIQIDYKRRRGDMVGEISKADISRVICNLLDNARRYTFEGEKRFVKIRCRVIQPENNVEISIQNFGTPIKKEEIENGDIFKFGFRGEFAYQYNREGTGAGLADAFDVIQAHKGSITVTSLPRIDDGDPPRYKVPFLTTVTIRIPKN